MEYSKLIGYTTITFQGEEIPVLMSSGAVRAFLEVFSIELPEISSLFKNAVINIDGKDVEVPSAKDPFKFAAAVLWSGADFCARLRGKPGYKIEEAYLWVDELGGIDSEAIVKIYTLFFRAIKNGGSPVKPEGQTGDDKKKEKL